MTLLSLQVMSGFLGPPTAILQEHGSTAATAAPLVGTTDTGGAAATAVATGIIRWVGYVGQVGAKVCHSTHISDGRGWRTALRQLTARKRHNGNIPSHTLPCHCCRQPTDVQVFSFTAGASVLATIGLYGASKMGSVVRSNLNTNLTLTGPTGTALTSQAGVGIAPFSVSLPTAGTYTVFLTPAGARDPKTDRYSTYGSRGQVGLFD